MKENNNFFPAPMVIGKKTFDFSKRSYLMGVLNVTPDSFSDGSKYLDPEAAVRRGLEMAAQGADIIDVGGESTRPGSDPVSAEEEINRVEPVIKELSKRTDIPISIDTAKAAVAVRALDSGAQMINDVSALRQDPALADAALSYKVPVVLMHMLGTPETMQQCIGYDSVVEDIAMFLRERIDFAVDKGLDRTGIIIDPGIGFGKSLENDNFEILKKLREFCLLGQPVLIGVSRKAFIGKLLDADIDERDPGTLAAVAIAIHNGANIVRVHNVLQMKTAVKIADAVIRAKA